MLHSWKTIAAIAVTAHMLSIKLWAVSNLPSLRKASRSLSLRIAAPQGGQHLNEALHRSQSHSLGKRSSWPL